MVVDLVILVMMMLIGLTVVMVLIVVHDDVCRPSSGHVHCLSSNCLSSNHDVHSIFVLMGPSNGDVSVS